MHVQEGVQAIVPMASNVLRCRRKIVYAPTFDTTGGEGCGPADWRRARLVADADALQSMVESYKASKATVFLVDAKVGELG